MSTHYENGKQVSENWNTVFRALSAEPRRQIILSLLDRSPREPVPLPESAMMPNVPSDQEALRRSLYHTHLPMLAEMGFIRWETDPLVATRGPRFEEAAVVFEALHSSATRLPDSLVVGCQRLEKERHDVVEQ